MAHITDFDHIASLNQENNFNGNTFFVHGDINDVTTFNPFTHIYMFDVGFPSKLHYSIAEKFNRSLYATCLVSYKPQTDIIKYFRFEVTLVHQMPTSMHGKSTLLS